MFKLIGLAFVGVVALGAYNYSNGRDLFSMPGTTALKNTVRQTAGAAVREVRAEVKDHAATGVHTAVNHAEEAVSGAAVTSKIKAKMALDDLVKASNIDVDTDGSVVTL